MHSLVTMLGDPLLQENKSHMIHKRKKRTPVRQQPDARLAAPRPRVPLPPFQVLRSVRRRELMAQRNYVDVT